jgi:thiamine biosynthesis protein ThiI
MFPVARAAAPAPLKSMTSVLVHYQELALKGRNRPWFISMLLRNLRSALADLDVLQVRALMGRVEIRLGPSAPWPEVRDRLARLPGIANFLEATHVAPDIDAIADGIVARLPGRTARSFRVAARRADKRFPLPSPEIERIIGRRVQDATGWPVDLETPDKKIYVEIVTHDAFYAFDKEQGVGGLPVGTSGKVLCLLSGGIDSPVAAWRVMRRGCRTTFVHFHSYPILSRTSQEKVRELARLLTRHQLRTRLYLVPFGAVQQQVVVTVPPPLRVVTYRRLMVRIAEQIARAEGAQALVTGDVVGQVASQTIENITVVDDAATMPILRPLVGFDKDEITAEAERLGTYRISIVPDDDCCTLFTPRFPATRADRRAALAAESRLDVEALVSAAVRDAVVEGFQFPMVESAVRQEIES